MKKRSKWCEMKKKWQGREGPTTELPIENGDPDRPYAEVEDAITRASAPLLRFMAQRDRRFRRIMHTLVVLLLVSLLGTLFIYSAVNPGVPILRQYEKNQERTGKLVGDINRQNQCTITWANQRPVRGCEDVYAILDQHELQSPD